MESYDREKDLAELKECQEKLIAGDMIIDTVSYMHNAIDDGK